MYTFQRKGAMVRILYRVYPMEQRASTTVHGGSQLTQQKCDRHHLPKNDGDSGETLMPLPVIGKQMHPWEPPTPAALAATNFLDWVQHSIFRDSVDQVKTRRGESLRSGLRLSWEDVVLIVGSAILEYKFFLFGRMDLISKTSNNFR